MNMKPRLQGPWSLLVTVLAAALLAAACSSDADSAGPEALASVYEQVDGLAPEARHEKLLELAAVEDTNLQLYTIVNLDDTAALLDAYDDALGLDIDVFRAQSNSLVQRVLEEDSAGRVGFDVLIMSAPEMVIIDDEDVLGPLETPYTASIVESTVNANWSGVYLNVFTAAWNSNIIEPGHEPTSWEEVFTAYPDALAIEAGDFDWFATLIEGYFVGELGYSEADAIDLFRAAAADARAIDGHTVLTELLGAGEFDVVTSAYQHGVERIKANGSPVEWQPAVEPLVVRPTGIAIHAGTAAPATALLFVDWLLSDAGQLVLAERFRTPASASVEGGVPAGLDILNVDVEALAENRQKWESLYEEIIQNG
jgi:iron(III) transport system substrate-binding protein